ncbi:MAG: hypothetical protein KatS3mg068_2156 [Candidatus Sericytochromatia bacterium]|nr:MAG: hypothetical protein KatS3mg068_2156 [Candidatus Sericytochromatia bacterium]
MQILSVIIIIGILIFVHELGHFLAAKFLKIPVKIFSIGFPLGNLPPLLKFNWKETECQLNLVPLGGFCAFLDDEKEIEKEPNDQRFLRNRKIWERFIVISGGVTGNLIFAIFVSIFMFFYLGIPEGREFQDGVTIVNVTKSSPAGQAGLKNFDNIIEVNKIPIKFNYDMKELFSNILKDNKEIEFSYLFNGKQEKSKIKTNEINFNYENFYGILITKVLPNSQAEKFGLLENDIIVEINKNNFSSTKNPEFYMKELLKSSAEKEVSIKLLRNNEYKELKAIPDKEGKLGIGIEFLKGLIVRNSKNNNIQSGSLIMEVNNYPLYENSSLMKYLISKNKNSQVDLTVLRKDEKINLKAKVSEDGTIGVQIQSYAKEIRRPIKSVIEPFIETTKYITGVTILLIDALGKMFTGNLSLKEIGGPIMVVAMGSEIAQNDFTKLFQFTILISIELVILNILPLPAVDGGHLFLLILEKIRGKKLSREFEEKIHYAGLMVLLGLGVFLIFKDILTLSNIIG